MQISSHQSSLLPSHIVTAAALGTPWIPDIPGAVEVSVGIAAIIYYIITLYWGFIDRNRQAERDKMADRQFHEKQVADVTKAAVIANAVVKAEEVKANASG